MKKIKTGDPIIVIAGKHKGKISKVMKVVGDKVYIEGVNIYKKAVKGEGHQEKVLPLHVSNVAYYVKDEKKGMRVGFTYDKEKKIRIIHKTSTKITA